MSSFFYMLSALFAMIPAPFLFQWKMSVPLRGALIAILLLGDELFTFLASSPAYPHYELLPFQMLSLTLCVSTLFLERRRRFFAALATGLWLWIDFFGMLSLSYRGTEFRALPLAILTLAFIPIFLMNPYRRESRFVLAVVWAAAWTLSFAWVGNPS